jgi:large subunit ribosomal protein L21
MYAVIRTGGKQYCVAAGDTLEVERLAGSIGDAVTISDVLLVSKGDTVTVGAPIVDGATVSAKITGQYRGNKIMVFKYRPKKRIRVRKGDQRLSLRRRHNHGTQKRWRFKPQRS